VKFYEQGDDITPRGLGFKGHFAEILFQLESSVIPSRHVWILIGGNFIFEFRIPSTQTECVSRNATDRVSCLPAFTVQNVLG
jgi:hypothetical protein